MVYPPQGSGGGGSAGSTPPEINLLTNGGFEIWQRGAGPFTADGAYTADRWQIDEAGTDALQVDRDGTTKRTNSQYSAKCAFTLGDSGTTRLRQRLVISDGYHSLLGKTISLRIAVHANAANAVRAVVTTDGTGGTSTYSSYHAGDSAFADLDVTGVSVPSDATYIEVAVQFEANATAYLDNAMLVASSSAADYQAMHPADEQARCERYFRIYGGASQAMGGQAYAESANLWIGLHSIPASFAASPTVTKNGTWTVSNCGQPGIKGSGKHGFTLYATASAAGNAIFYCDGADDTITGEANP